MLTISAYYNLFILFSLTTQAVSYSYYYQTPKYSQSIQNNEINDIHDNIFWFVQISDIHISKFVDPNRSTDLTNFCKLDLKIINPDIVIASGDLTDARKANHLDSDQQPEEWEAYNRAVNDSGILDSVIWFDIPGNHDKFNVPLTNSKKHMYSKYGFTSSKIPPVHKYDLIKSYGVYSFVRMDLTVSPGIKFPLNFFGFLSKAENNLIQDVATSIANSNQSFWFGHYPTSVVITSGLDLVSVLGQSAFAYLCGHLHTVLGLAPKMYAYHREGFWEWELGDWRDKRYFRIVAVDHDLVSFVDVKRVQDNEKENSQSNWPIILITNPKNSEFLLPDKEPLAKLKSSTHIRILVWSDAQIEFVSVSIDGIELGNAKPARLKENSDIENNALYVLPWDPHQYSGTGSTHNIVVTVKDSKNRTNMVSQNFALDKTSQNYYYSVIPQFILLTSLSQNIHTLFYGLWSIIFLFFVFAKVMKRYNSPLYMGYLVEGSFGIVFSFGIYVNSILVYEPVICLYEIIQLLLFSGFLMCYLPYCGKMLPYRVDHKRKYHSSLTSQSGEDVRIVAFNRCHGYCSCLGEFFDKIPSPLIIVLILFTLFEFILGLLTTWISYGFLSFVLCPARQLPVVVAWLLCYWIPEQFPNEKSLME